MLRLKGPGQFDEQLDIGIVPPTAVSGDDQPPALPIVVYDPAGRDLLVANKGARLVDLVLADKALDLDVELPGDIEWPRKLDFHRFANPAHRPPAQRFRIGPAFAR